MQLASERVPVARVRKKLALERKALVEYGRTNQKEFHHVPSSRFIDNHTANSEATASSKGDSEHTVNACFYQQSVLYARATSYIVLASRTRPTACKNYSTSRA
jgi:hypothetical protein